MPRRRVPISAIHPYHINARCINREWFKIPLPAVWSLMEDYLYLVAHLYTLQIHSFVLMSNHFHWLLTAPEGNLSAALNYFMRETAREISRLSGRINQTYGSRNHKTLICSHHHFVDAYKYVYRNPVRAGICERVEDYPYSTLHGLVGRQRLAIPLCEDKLLFTPAYDEKTLLWLNKKPKEGHEEEMRKVLRRPVFELVTDRKTQKPSGLELELL